MPSRPRSPIRTAAVGAAMVLLLAGCTGGETSPSPSASASASASPSAGDPGITDVTDTPGGGTDGAGGGFTGALSDATCTPTRSDDGWDVTGTVENPTDAAATYRIYVSLLTGGGETRALTQVDVADVAAGASTDWDAAVPLDEDGLTCVLRVERYAA